MKLLRMSGTSARSTFRRVTASGVTPSPLRTFSRAAVRCARAGLPSWLTIMADEAIAVAGACLVGGDGVYEPLTIALDHRDSAAGDLAREGRDIDAHSVSVGSHAQQLSHRFLVARCCLMPKFLKSIP